MSTPAGWYPDPEMAHTQRYWDGEGWTEHRAPSTAPASATAPAPGQETGQGGGQAASPPPAAHPGTPGATKPGATTQVDTKAHGDAAAQGKDEPSYAWALALLPLVGVVIDLTVPELNAGYAVLAGFLVVNAVLVYLDHKRLTARGANSPGPLVGILLIPVYLIHRTILVRSSPAIPLVWFATFAASALSTYLAPGPYDFDSDEISSDIASQIRDQAGIRVTVSCPEATGVVADDTITCDVFSRRGETATVLVTFTDDGGYVWEGQP